MLFGDKCACYIFVCMVNKGKAVTECREAQWQMFLKLKMQMSTEVNWKWIEISSLLSLSASFLTFRESAEL